MEVFLNAGQFWLRPCKSSSDSCDSFSVIRISLLTGAAGSSLAEKLVQQQLELGNAGITVDQVLQQIHGAIDGVDIAKATALEHPEHLEVPAEKRPQQNHAGVAYVAGLIDGKLPLALFRCRRPRRRTRVACRWLPDLEWTISLGFSRQAGQNPR